MLERRVWRTVVLLAMVPLAPPARKNQRATSCPAPISAKTPYLLASRLICRAFWCVSVGSFIALNQAQIARAAKSAGATRAATG